MNASKLTAWKIGTALWLVGCGLVSSPAQMLLSPLHVGNTTPMVNEFGDVLPGHAAQPGALVLVLWASNNVIYPPAIDGQPDLRNAPVMGGVSGVGFLAPTNLAQPGIFSMAMPRLSNGARIFMRVFNQPTLEASSFYADSALFTVDNNKVFDGQIGATTNPLDTADADGDGLHNAWEKSYGSSSSSADSDQDGLNDLTEHQMGLSPVREDTDLDGMIDGHEWRAGTDANNQSSYLGLAQMQVQQANLVLQWASVTGKLYQVEDTVADLLQPRVFSNLTGVITASDGPVTSTVITNAMDSSEVHIFRIRLVEE